MADPGYTLYARRGAGSLATQIALEEIGVDYRLVWVGKSPEETEMLRRLNPAGKIPVLALPDGTVMHESAAMLIHLAAAHPEAALAPAPGSAAHAQFLQWMVFLSANVYEAALRYFYSERYSTAGETAAAPIKQQALADWARHFGIVQAALSPYVLGERLSAADFYLHMLAGWFPADDAAPGAAWAGLQQHARLLQQRPSTRRAQADHAEV